MIQNMYSLQFVFLCCQTLRWWWDDATLAYLIDVPQYDGFVCIRVESHVGGHLQPLHLVPGDKADVMWPHANVPDLAWVPAPRLLHCPLP